MSQNKWKYGDLLFGQGWLSVLVWVVLVPVFCFLVSVAMGYLEYRDWVATNRFPEPVKAPIDPAVVAEQVKEEAKQRAENLKKIESLIKQAAAYERQAKYAAGEEKFFLYPIVWKHCQGPVLGPGLWHVIIYKWVSDRPFKFDLTKGPADGEAEEYTNFTLDTIVKPDAGRQIGIPGGFSEPDSLFFYH